LLFVGLGLALVATTAAAGQGKRHFRAVLDGYHEVPAISSTGHGEFIAEIMADGNIAYSLTYGDLEGTAAAAHIHLGQRDVNGGGDKPACPVAGTVSGVIDPTDIIGPTMQGIAPGEMAEVLRAMRAGVIYANVHTSKHGGGEIRGQVGNRDRQGNTD